MPVLWRWDFLDCTCKHKHNRIRIASYYWNFDMNGLLDSAKMVSHSAGLYYMCKPFSYKLHITSKCSRCDVNKIFNSTKLLFHLASPYCIQSMRISYDHVVAYLGSKALDVRFIAWHWRYKSVMTKTEMTACVPRTSISSWATETSFLHILFRYEGGCSCFFANFLAAFFPCISAWLSVAVRDLLVLKLSVILL